ncbi:MAG: tetratricopeptide repeat protein [Nitrospirae bacterium]|nr:tetratricopeptide repeat protein [Nitrospirota bacterium]
MQAALGWAAACALFAGAPGAALAAGAVAPVSQAFETHKGAVLAVEADLRATPDAALTGLPGQAVMLLACDGAGCVGPHQVRVDGVDDLNAVNRWLADAFPQGGWVPVALPRKGPTVELVWQAGERFDVTRVTLPAPGNVVRVTRQGGAIEAAEQAPGAEHAWRVAMAELARGDRLAAIAVLDASARLFGPPADGRRLTLADLAREAGLPGRAENAYQELAASPNADVRNRARLGSARLAVDAGRLDEAVAILSALALSPGPDADAAHDLLIRALLALGRDHDAVAVPAPDGAGPFLSANRAMAFQAVGDTFSAVTELERAVRLCNNSVPVEALLRERLLLALGTVLAEQGRLERAVEVFGEMSPQGPFGDRHRFARGLAFFGNGEMVKAVAEFQALEREHPSSPYAMEGLLVMGEAFRALNAPRQAVAQYRKALDLYHGRTRAVQVLLDESRVAAFDAGITGLIFTPGWQPGDGGQARVTTGLGVLFRTPGFARLLDEHRQIGFATRRLEAARRLLRAGGDPALAKRVNAGLDGLAVFRGMFQAAARELVIRTLEAERDQVEELSITASLGITQSVLFDSTGRDGSDLVFGADR